MKGLATFWAIFGLANAAWLAVLLATDFSTIFSIVTHAILVVWCLVMFRYCIRRVE